MCCGACSDGATGSAGLAALLLFLAYVAAWLLASPFLAPGDALAPLFPLPRGAAVATAAVGFALTVAVATAFVGCVMLRGSGGGGTRRRAA